MSKKLLFMQDCFATSYLRRNAIISSFLFSLIIVQFTSIKSSDHFSLVLKTSVYQSGGLCVLIRHPWSIVDQYFQSIWPLMRLLVWGDLMMTMTLDQYPQSTSPLIHDRHPAQHSLNTSQHLINSWLISD